MKNPYAPGFWCAIVALVLLSATYFYGVMLTHQLDKALIFLDSASAQQLSELADQCADAWRQPDAGMWELEDEQHYTMSKISCWQALARAVVQAFADHPGAGVVALDGAMLDRPHLALAQRLLGEASTK